MTRWLCAFIPFPSCQRCGRLLAFRSFRRLWICAVTIWVTGLKSGDRCGCWKVWKGQFDSESTAPVCYAATPSFSHGTKKMGKERLGLFDLELTAPVSFAATPSFSHGTKKMGKEKVGTIRFGVDRPRQLCCHPLLFARNEKDGEGRVADAETNIRRLRVILRFGEVGSGCGIGA